MREQRKYEKEAVKLQKTAGQRKDVLHKLQDRQSNVYDKDLRVRERICLCCQAYHDRYINATKTYEMKVALA